MINTWLKDYPAQASRMRDIIKSHSNMLDADRACREYFASLSPVQYACLAMDLIESAIAWADWTGIVNELRGEGRTTTDLIDHDDPATKEYSGWKNYATWAIDLWLSNEEPLYNRCRNKTADELKQIVKSIKPQELEDTRSKPSRYIFFRLYGKWYRMADWDRLAEAFKN